MNHAAISLVRQLRGCSMVKRTGTAVAAISGRSIGRRHNAAGHQRLSEAPGRLVSQAAHESDADAQEVAP